MAEITPNDIINKEFRLALRGYATEQVDDFLQHVSDSQLRLLEENKRLQTQVEDLRSRLKQYQQTEDLMKGALVLAERAAEDARQRAQEEADLIRREADAEVRDAHATVEQLRQSRLRVAAELRAVLQAHLSLLDAQERRASDTPETPERE